MQQSGVKEYETAGAPLENGEARRPQTWNATQWFF